MATLVKNYAIRTACFIFVASKGGLNKGENIRKFEFCPSEFVNSSFTILYGSVPIVSDSVFSNHRFNSANYLAGTIVFTAFVPFASRRELQRTTCLRSEFGETALTGLDDALLETIEDCPDTLPQRPNSLSAMRRRTSEDGL
jgi:hypothetical protein